jgi:Protein of unknown function (DUF3348)
MTQVSRHTRLTGSEFIRSLARLAGPQAEALCGTTPVAFSTQLSQWLGWTDAVALASALDGGAATGSPLQGDAPAQLLEEGLRVRVALTKALSTHNTDSASPGRWPVKPRAGARGGVGLAEDPTDFATHRRQVHAQQQAMDTAVSSLRARLRAALAAASPQHARLAAVDAVMEQALLPQAQRLTSTVGALLERRFRGLQAIQVSEPALAWLDVFRQDLQAVLLAELDFRFQPIEGLMAALRSTLFAATAAELEPT